MLKTMVNFTKIKGNHGKVPVRHGSPSLFPSPSRLCQKACLALRAAKAGHDPKNRRINMPLLVVDDWEARRSPLSFFGGSPLGWKLPCCTSFDETSQIITTFHGDPAICTERNGLCMVVALFIKHIESDMYISYNMVRHTFQLYWY